MTPERISPAGLTRSFQIVRTYDELTLEDNLCTAAQASDGLGWLPWLLRSRACRASETLARRRAADLLAMIGLQPYATLQRPCCPMASASCWRSLPP